MKSIRELQEEIRQLRLTEEFINFTLRKELIVKLQLIERQWNPSNKSSTEAYFADSEHVQMQLDMNYIVLQDLRDRIKTLEMLEFETHIHNRNY